MRRAARLLVGADGRISQVREAAGIALHQDPPHHWFAGLLVDGVEGWSDDLQAIGTEGDFALPGVSAGRGPGARLRRLRAGPGRPVQGAGRSPPLPRRLRHECSPDNRHLAAGRPAGPLFSYFNNDSWTDEPFAAGVVLVGDAAGWNDPIIGLGLSITYRDVRIVSELLKGSDDWAAPLVRALCRGAAPSGCGACASPPSLQAALDMEFGEAAKARRRSHFERAAADPTLARPRLRRDGRSRSRRRRSFTEEHRARVLGA